MASFHCVWVMSRVRAKETERTDVFMTGKKGNGKETIMLLALGIVEV